MTSALGIGVEGAAGDWWCSLVGLDWQGDLIHDPWKLAELRRDDAGARLVVVLCDPVVRFTADDVTGTLRAAANASFQRGLYADLLSRLWRLFPRDHVLVLQQERCVQDPAVELARTSAFLSLDGQPNPTPPPPSPTPSAPLRPDQRQMLARRYAPENRRLAALIPDLDLDLWERAA